MLGWSVQFQAMVSGYRYLLSALFACNISIRLRPPRLHSPIKVKREHTEYLYYLLMNFLVGSALALKCWNIHGKIWEPKRAKLLRKWLYLYVVWGGKGRPRGLTMILIYVARLLVQEGPRQWNCRYLYSFQFFRSYYFARLSGLLPLVWTCVLFLQSVKRLQTYEQLPPSNQPYYYETWRVLFFIFVYVPGI